MKVIREQLIEAAKTNTDFKSKYNISKYNLQSKDKFFWSVIFSVFFRLQIYEAIAAIFWQSASYVWILLVFITLARTKSISFGIFLKICEIIFLSVCLACW